MKAKILFFILLLCGVYTLQGQVSGTVFRDFNGNGTKESAEPLVAGILVKAYDASGAQCGTTQTTTSASAPNYTISGCSGSVRIEFEIPSSGCQINNAIDYSALGATQYGSSVQFVNSTASNVNFAIHYPGEYGGADSFTPDIYSVVMVGGNPLLAGTAQVAPTIVKTPYSASGTVMWPAPAAGDLPASKSQRQVGHTTVAQASQTGNLWGMAYSKQANKLYASAFLRRHGGLGPQGPGGVYIADPATISLSANLNFFDFDTDLGIATHSSAGVYNTDPMKVGTNAQRLLPANPAGVPTADAPAYDQVGKVSLGDLDISDDGRYLFITNLYDRKLYRIDLQDAASPVKPTAAQVIGYTIPNPCTGANAGESRPFGLKVFRGKLYVGTVCSGQTSANAEVGNSTTMGAYVYEFDLSTLSFNTTPVYSQNFSYRDATKLQNNPPYITNGNWDPWKNEFEFWDYNQPWLTDIEFDAEGNMILGLTDRNSYQTGSANYNTAGTGSFSKTYANGDNLHLTKTGTNTCTYTITDNDYYRDCAQFSISLGDDPNCVAHNETSFGPMAVHRFGNKDELVAMALNPVTHISNGFNFYNNDNGDWVKGNELWYDPAFDLTSNTLWGKAGGVGDIEVFSPQSPIEIGNRVWNDTDSDGVQDAGENPIQGVTVELVKNGSVIATATTSADGNYYFSNATGTNTASVIYGITQLMPDMEYIVRIPNVQGGSKQAALGTNSLTTANVGGAGQPDVRDSDGTLVGNNAEVTVMTTSIPVAGANNHTFDFGFTSAPTCTVSIACNPLPQTSCTPPNGSATTTVTGAQGNLTYMWSSGEATSSITGKVAGTYTVTITDDFLPGCTSTCQAVIGSTVTLPTAQCNPTPNSNCATPNGTATVATNADQILWSNGGTTATITGLSANTYTVTVTNTTTGCTNTCQAVVTNSTVSPTCTIATNSQPSCANLTGGSVTVTPSPAGTYTYAWSDNGAATANRTGLTGGTYTVTVTNTTTNCTGVCNVTLTTPTNCCNIAAIVPQNLECLDNGTPGNITDNRIRFNALVTNTNTSLTSYNVTINGGTTTITPNTNVPYGVTQFTLGPGTAGGGATFTVTVTDSATPGCSQTFQVIDPGNCPPATQCPTPKCGTATIQVNGN